MDSQSLFLRFGNYLPLAMICGLVVSGCGQQEDIRHYPVPKAASVETDSKSAMPDGHPELPEGHPELSPQMPAGHPDVSGQGQKKPGRMLGAIAIRDNRSWYFKMTGSDEAVQDQMEEFLALVQSIKFAGADGSPSWKLPEGWKQEPSSGMRFATIRVPAADPPLEMSVIPLPNLSGGVEQTLLENINRWRGQMSVPALGVGDLKEFSDSTGEVRTVKAADGSDVTLVNFIGTMSSGSSMRAPFAGGMGGMFAPMASPKAKPTAEKPSATEPAPKKESAPVVGPAEPPAGDSKSSDPKPQKSESTDKPAS